MKKSIILALLVSFFVGNTLGQTKNFIDQNYVRVEGNATLKVVPNEITLRIVINEKDYKNRKLDELEKTMKKQLIKQGVDVEKQLKISDSASNFKQYWYKKSDVVLSREYELKLTDAQTLIKVFAALQSEGISDVSIVSLDHSDRENLKNQVKADAMKNAKERAELLAKAVGQEIGRALLIEDTRDYGYSRPMLMKMNTVSALAMEDSALDMAAGAAQLEFENIEFQANVSVTFELK